MYIQLPACDDFRGFDLSHESELAPTANRIYELFANPPLLTFKRHLYVAHIPKKLFKSIRRIHLGDKKGRFTQSMLFRRGSKITTPWTFIVLAEMDLVDYGDDATSPRLQYPFRNIRRLRLSELQREDENR